MFAINLSFVVALTIAGIIGEDIQISIDAGRSVHVVGNAFHGVALDASIYNFENLRNNLNLNSKKLATLLNALSPGYLRVGGTSANWLFFDVTDEELKDYNFPKANNLSKKEFDDIVSLVQRSGLRLLFDINAEIRNPDGTWDSSNAKKLLDYCIQKKYNNIIDWELGNEPNHISKNNLTPKQVGEDFVKFYKFLKNYPQFKDSAIVGPDVGWMGVHYIRGVADAAGQYLNAYTIHQYYFDGTTATVNTYTNSSYFEKLDQLFEKVRKTLTGSLYANKPLWLGETSDGYSSGTKGVSDRYVSGFLHLDKLGLSAVNKVDVVIRQTIVNGNYALLNFTTHDPNPDYWLIFVHNQLVGQKVLKVDISGNSGERKGIETIRVYSHCTKIRNSSYVIENYGYGSVTIFALNVHPNKKRKLVFNNTDMFGGEIHSYILTPGEDKNLLSKFVRLNGEILKMPSETRMPSIAPRVINSIELEPMTFGFFVFPGANAKECKK